MPKINRRDFIKLLGASPFLFATPKITLTQRPDQKNVLIVVFDAFSAYNISLYGYGRETTPNIAKMADTAIVFHNHYAGSNYTTSGTASLLTGTYPWTHRALQPNSTPIDVYKKQNIFSVFKNHHRIAYSHNLWVNTLFQHFSEYIDEFIPRQQLTLFSFDKFIESIFSNDVDIASVSWARNVKAQEESANYSLILSRFVNFLENRYAQQYLAEFPRGLPTSGADSGFLLEHSIDWVVQRVLATTEPVFGYFHFFPPHDPYRTHNEFIGKFRKDGFEIKDKPIDIFANEVNKPFRTKRQYYDEFILYVDREFKRMYDMLEEAGKLENTIIVLTSDHGEIFERGIAGHITSALYQPLIRIPLLIFEPNRKVREDIYEPTSAVDILPTLAYLTGQQVPDWSEGRILPPYQKDQLTNDRKIFSVLSYNTENEKTITHASLTYIKGKYKLHYYFGYAELNGKELVRLFDIETDPDELNDMSESYTDLAIEMLSELKNNLAKAEEPYL
jgi:arylsulfatase A-like enzyme